MGDRQTSTKDIRVTSGGRKKELKPELSYHNIILAAKNIYFARQKVDGQY